MNLENSKPKKPQKFVRNLPERLDLRSSNKHVALQKVSIYYTGKNMRKQFKKNKLKIIAPTLNDELNYLIVLILCQIFKIVSNISSKSKKH